MRRVDVRHAHAQAAARVRVSFPSLFFSFFLARFRLLTPSLAALALAGVTATHQRPGSDDVALVAAIDSMIAASESADTISTTTALALAPINSSMPALISQVRALRRAGAASDQSAETDAAALTCTIGMHPDALHPDFVDAVARMVVANHQWAFRSWSSNAEFIAAVGARVSELLNHAATTPPPRPAIAQAAALGVGTPMSTDIGPMLEALLKKHASHLTLSNMAECSTSNEGAMKKKKKQRKVSFDSFCALHLLVDPGDWKSSCDQRPLSCHALLRDTWAFVPRGCPCQHCRRRCGLFGGSCTRQQLGVPDAAV